MITGVVASSESSDGDGKSQSNTAKDLHIFWGREIEAFQKRTAKFKKQGDKVVSRYIDERGNAEQDGSSSKAFRLNMFHRNVSTLDSMLFGTKPKVDVKREHSDPTDDTARVAANILKRILEADVQCSGDDFSTTLHAALQDRLLPGLGTARVLYDYKASESKTVDPQTIDVVSTPTLDSESATVEYVHWQDFAWGWARTWREVPWIGYLNYLDKDQATDRFGEEVAKRLVYENQLPSGDRKGESSETEDTQSNVQRAKIWEIWDNRTKKVYWWSNGVDKILDSVDDPLGLRGFFPSPMPMMANVTTKLMMPRADFVIYQDLYNEVDVLQTRISIITEAVKVVGVYDSQSGPSVGRMLKEGHENDLIPVENWAMFAEKGGLRGTIDWFPVGDVVATLGTLRDVLNTTIQLLYEATGMSDILRGGNTDQYTSDGTNQLKAKFGSIRIQALQDDFARFASDLDALKAEVIGKHYSPQTIIQQSSAMFLPDSDKDKVNAAITLIKSPAIKWRVEIKPESIAMVDYAQLKQERTEFLTAMATYLQSAQAAAKSIPGSLPMLIEMLKWGMAGFKGSDYLEGIMDKALDDLAKAPPDQGGDEGKAQAEAEQQRIQLEHRNEMQKISAKAQADIAVQQEKHRASMELEQIEHRNAMEQEITDHKNTLQKMSEEFMADMKLLQENLTADLATERAQSAYAIEEEQVSHSNKMRELGANHSSSMIQKEKDAENASMDPTSDNT